MIREIQRSSVSPNMRKTCGLFERRSGAWPCRLEWGRKAGDGGQSKSLVHGSEGLNGCPPAWGRQGASHH